MDKFFSLFTRTFGNASSTEAVPGEFLSKYREVLPESLLEFWQEQGWGTYMDGLLWTLNPERLNGLIEDWVVDLPDMAGVRYFAFARSAFGCLYAVRSDSGRVVRIDCAHGQIVVPKNFSTAEKDKDLLIRSFFACARPEDFDLSDEDGEKLFVPAMKKLGHLTSNEIYGFEPLMSLGGTAKLENLRKLRMDVHIDILRQFTNPKLYIAP